MALTQISTDGIKDGTITGADLATNVDLVDNKKIRFGTGNDLEIYHNGTASFISNTTGDLKIDSDNIKIRQSNGNAFIKCQSTAVELYYADNKKFETNSEGVRINGFLEMLDNQRIQMGDGDDLQIYHNGSESWIRNSTGTLNVLNDGVFQFKNLADNETIAQFEADGACSLYYNNSKKFETTASGVDVTGNCTITGNFRGNDGVMLNLGNGDDLQIYHDGSDDRIMSGSTNSTIFASKYLRIMNQAANETMAKFFENGAVELYYDNSKKFETTNLGAQITGELSLTTHLKLLDDQKVVCGNGEDLLIYHDGTNNIINDANSAKIKIQRGGSDVWELKSTGLQGIDNQKLILGTSDDLQIYHDGNDSFIKDSGTGGIRIDSNQTVLRNAAGDEHMIQCVENGDVTLYQNGSYRAATRSWGFQVAGVLAPEGDNNHDIGFSSERWDDVYATNGTIQTSDKNEKNTITASDLGLSFVNKLKPVSYKFNNKTRTHYGLIAQDVETTLSDISKPTSGFAGFIKEDIPDKLYVEDDDIPEGKKVGDVKTAAFTTYGLRYHEFISPLIKAVQELSAEVETLKTEVAALKAS